MDIIYTVLYKHTPATATSRWWAEELKRMRTKGQTADQEWPLTEFENNLIHINSDPLYFIRKSACDQLPTWLGFQHDFKLVERLNDKRSPEILIKAVELRVKNKLPVILTYRVPTRDLHRWDITRLFLKGPVELTFLERLSQLREFIYDAHMQAISVKASPERMEARTLSVKAQKLFDDYLEGKMDVQKENVLIRLVDLEFEVRDLRKKVLKKFAPSYHNPTLKSSSPKEHPSAEDKAKLEYLKSLAAPFMESYEEKREENSEQKEFEPILEIYFK